MQLLVWATLHRSPYCPHQQSFVTAMSVRGWVPNFLIGPQVEAHFDQPEGVNQGVSVFNGLKRQLGN
jgi:hypothetical protein